MSKDDATKPMETLETNEVPKTEAKVVKTNLEHPNPDVEMVNIGGKSLKKPCPNLSKKKLPRSPKSPNILMKIGPFWTKLGINS